MSVMGVWMWPQSVRVYGAKTVVSRCIRIGVTDIFFLAKGLAGTTAHLSQFAPACCERDLLRELLEEAHKQGIRVHAWLTSASDEHYKALHPASGRVHITRGADKGLISLADDGYIAYMQQIVSELCSAYDIDGLHLDYIRYNHLLYGWSDDDCARYEASGADLNLLRSLMQRTFLRDADSEPDCIFDALRAGNESVRALANTRRQDVVRFAQALTSTIRAERSNLTLSAALMPEGAYDDTTFSDLHYGQNYDDAAKLYDVVLPMAYSKAYEKDADWVKSVAHGTSRRGLQTIMGLHAYDGGTAASLKADIAALEETAIKGICLFREGAFAAAIPDHGRLCLINMLEKPITSLVSSDGHPLLPSGKTIAPGEEIILQGDTDVLSAFSGEDEVCVFIPEQK